MKEIIKHINLNVGQPNNFQLITAMQNDNETIKVVATLYNGNSLYTIDNSIDLIRLTGRAANGALIDITITDYTEHTVTFVLSKNMLSSDGDMKLSISMTDSSTGQILSTYPFIIKVHNSPQGSFSESEIKSLDSYVEKVKKYTDEAEAYANSWKGSILPQGDITFSQLPTFGMIKGYMYCVTDFFNTDSRFEEGSNYFYPAGTCVYWTENNQWKCLSGVLSRKLTQAEYNALSVEEQNNGTIYYIDDGDNEIKIATTKTDGLMSALDKTKLEELYNKGGTSVNIDSNLSETSTNPVQNKVIATALNGKANNIHQHGNNDITDIDASKLTGTIDIARLPQGALDRLVKVADDDAKFALTTNDIQLGDTVKVTSTGKMYYVVDENKLSSSDGYEPYTADSATSVPWSGVTGKPNSYTPSVHNHDDRYYSESEIDTKLNDKVDLSADGVSKAINKLSTAGSTPCDVDYYVAQYANGGTTTTSYHRRPMKALWEYIKIKISSVLGLTSSSYNGNAASATTVNGHTVDSDVPSNAVFTDTTYSVATTQKNGLMSSNDKSNMENLLKSYADNTLQTGTDFNDVTTEGKYYMYHQNTYTNKPPISNGFVDVKAYGSVIKQYVYRQGTIGVNDYEIYERTGLTSSGNWSDWIKILTAKDLTTALTVTTTGTPLDATAGKDLNDKITTINTRLGTGNSSSYMTVNTSWSGTNVKSFEINQLHKVGKIVELDLALTFKVEQAAGSKAQIGTVSSGILPRCEISVPTSSFAPGATNPNGTATAELRITTDGKVYWYNSTASSIPANGGMKAHAVWITN